RRPALLPGFRAAPLSRLPPHAVEALAHLHDGRRLLRAGAAGAQERLPQPQHAQRRADHGQLLGRREPERSPRHVRRERGAVLAGGAPRSARGALLIAAMAGLGAAGVGWLARRLPARAPVAEASAEQAEPAPRAPPPPRFLTTTGDEPPSPPE